MLPSQAAQLKGLYEVEVELADQGREARARAMSEAMAAVLLKVSGKEALLEEEVIQSAMADASRYVSQYRYRSEAAPSEQRAGAAESRLWLWVAFDSASIDNLLRQYGFTVWSAARPTTLVWLAVEEGARRVLVGAHDQGLVREVLETEAQRRAIPIALPLLDLTDQARVRAVDIWGGFIDNIEAASQRYEPQALLIGKLYAVGGSWEARWTLRYQGEQHEWQQGSKDVSAVIAAGIAGSSDFLSQRFAQNSYLGVDQLALRVEGVEGMNAFRRVSDYLQSLHGVSTVTLRRVDARASSFLIEIEGGRESVLQAIALGDVLVRVENPLPESLRSPELEAPYQPAPPRQPALAPSSAPELSPAQPTAPGTAGETQPAQERVDDSGQSAPQPQAIPLQELVYRLLS